MTTQNILALIETGPQRERRYISPPNFPPLALLLLVLPPQPGIHDTSEHPAGWLCSQGNFCFINPPRLQYCTNLFSVPRPSLNNPRRSPKLVRADCNSSAAAGSSSPNFVELVPGPLGLLMSRGIVSPALHCRWLTQPFHHSLCNCAEVWRRARSSFCVLPCFSRNRSTKVSTETPVMFRSLSNVRDDKADGMMVPFQQSLHHHAPARKTSSLKIAHHRTALTCLRKATRLLYRRTRTTCAFKESQRSPPLQELSSLQYDSQAGNNDGGTDSGSRRCHRSVSGSKSGQSMKPQQRTLAKQAAI